MIMTFMIRMVTNDDMNSELQLCISSKSNSNENYQSEILEILLIL